MPACLDIPAGTGTLAKPSGLVKYARPPFSSESSPHTCVICRSALPENLSPSFSASFFSEND